MNVLAVVPARGGSKQIPRKNLREVGGKPLLVWSIEAALEAKKVDMVVVSSDDAEILDVARRAGAIGQERPAELATDEAKLDPVLRHVVLNMAGYHADVVVLLQPTCPIRRPGLIDDCIQRLYDTDADSLLTATPVVNCWWRTDREEWAEQAVWETNNPTRLQRQQMRRITHWSQDGSVRVTRRWLLTSDDPGQKDPACILGGRIQVFPNETGVDIDSEADLAAADALLRQEAIV